MEELVRREAASNGKLYRTRIAANILCAELIGHITTQDGSLLRI